MRQIQKNIYKKKNSRIQLYQIVAGVLFAQQQRAAARCAARFVAAVRARQRDGFRARTLAPRARLIEAAQQVVVVVLRFRMHQNERQLGDQIAAIDSN